jgi:molybdopterin-guanine dinucleotide biosynthesis protein B
MIHELGDAPEATLAQLLERISPCDLVIVEGFKREAIPKVEVYRSANGRPPLHPDDPLIVAVASDVPFADAAVPVVDLNDADAVAMLMRDAAKPIDRVLRDLEARALT